MKAFSLIIFWTLVLNYIVLYMNDKKHKPDMGNMLYVYKIQL